MMKLELLPFPRSVRRHAGFFSFPKRPAVYLDSALSSKGLLLPIAARLQAAVGAAGAELELAIGPSTHPRLAIRALLDPEVVHHTGGYRLRIDSRLISLHCRDEPGLHAGVATIR